MSAKAIVPVGPEAAGHWREREFERHLQPVRSRAALRTWAWLARHPRLYRWATAAASTGLGWLGRKRGGIASLPLAEGWTAARDLPAPEGGTFLGQWAAGKRRAGR